MQAFISLQHHAYRRNSNCCADVRVQLRSGNCTEVLTSASNTITYFAWPLSDRLALKTPVSIALLQR